MIARRSLLAVSVALFAAPAHSAQSLKAAKIYTLEGCLCCKGWITHMRRAGYAPTLEVVHDVVALSTKRGVKSEFSSCHMAVVEGYVVLGHVPPADVDRLAREAQGHWP